MLLWLNRSRSLFLIIYNPTSFGWGGTSTFPVEISTSTHVMKMELQPMIPLDKKKLIDDIITFIPWRTCTLHTWNKTKTTCPISSSMTIFQIWQKNIVNDVIMTVISPGDNLQTRYKMRTRRDISGFTSSSTYKICQTSRHRKIIPHLTLSWMQCCLDSIYRADTKWVREFVSQILQVLWLWNFVRSVCMTKEF